MVRSNWLDYLEKVIQFYEKHGRYPVKTIKADEYERRLAHWRHHNHSLLHRGKLNEKRASLFKKAGLDIDHCEQAWRAMLKRTVEFVEIYGRFPSRNGKTKEERTVGRWRTDQNGFLKRGILSKERARLFTEAGLDGTIFDKVWYAMLRKVNQFVKEYGYLPRATGDLPNESWLAIWCNNNRVNYRKGLLTDRQKALLNASGITDPSKFRSRWGNNYKRLESFCRAHNRLPAYDGEGEEGVIYKWLIKQIVHANKNVLSAERFSMIEEIRSQYNPAKETAESKWRRKYLLFHRFIEKTGRIPRHTKRRSLEYSLAIWLENQKSRFKEKKLSDTEIQLLKKLHPSLKDLEAWSTSGIEKQYTQWMKKYAMVRKIAETSGYAPDQKSKNTEERRLRGWLDRQVRKNYQGRLDGERAKLISELKSIISYRKPGPKGRE